MNSNSIVVFLFVLSCFSVGFGQTANQLPLTVSPKSPTKRNHEKPYLEILEFNKLRGLHKRDKELKGKTIDVELKISGFTPSEGIGNGPLRPQIVINHRAKRGTELFFTTCVFYEGEPWRFCSAGERVRIRGTVLFTSTANLWLEDCELVAPKGSPV